MRNRLFKILHSNQRGEMNIGGEGGGSGGWIWTIVIVFVIFFFIAQWFVPMLQTESSDWSLESALNYIWGHNMIAWAVGGLTDNEIPYYSSGMFSGETNFSYNPATNTLDVDTLTTPTGRGETFIVAANNANAVEKAQADYVCDGTNDDVEIQAAIDALNTTGEVRLTSGTFIVRSNGVTLNNANMTLSGTRSSIIQLADLQAGGDVIFIDAANVTLDGFTLDGNFAGQALAWGNYIGIESSADVNLTISNCEIKNVGSSAILVHTNSHYAMVKNCYIHDCGEGIVFANSNYYVCTDNILVNTGTGSNTTQDGIEPSCGSYGVITNNVIVNTDGAPIDLYGNSDSNTIANNICYTYDVSATQSAGIMLRGTGGQTNDYNRIYGNYIYNSGAGSGIYVSESNKNTFSNNVIRDMNGVGGKAIWVRDNSHGNSFDGNEIYDTNTYGIACDTSGNSFTNNIIEATKVYCIQASGGSNIISGNNLKNTDTNAIIRTEGNYNIITGNICDVNNDANIRGIWSAGDYDTITGNSIINCATTDYEIVFAGINTICDINTNFIRIGENKSVASTLTAGNANAIAFAWNNPFKRDILIKKVVVEVTTVGGTVGSHLDVGIADDATGTNRGTEFFNDLLLNEADVNDSWVGGDGGTQTKWVVAQDSVSATDDWIVGQILDANAANLVGKYYIEYVGR